MARSLPTNSGSVESLNCFTRCGCKPCARQMRWMELALIPTAFAFGRLFTLEDASSIAAGFSHEVKYICSITCQPAGLCIFTIVKHRGQRIARRRRADLSAANEKKRISTNQQHHTGLLRELRKGRFDLSSGAGTQDFDLNSKARGADLKVLDKGISQRGGGVDERKIVR